MPIDTARLLSPGDVARLRADHPETRLLDVRTPGEFGAEHIAGAFNVPLDALAGHAAAIRASVAAPIVLVCRSGQRARRAETTLAAAGVTGLHVLEGGVAAWTAAGLDVVRGASRLSLERQVRIAAGLLAATGGFLALLVDARFAALPAFVGSGLVFAGVTDTCMLGMLLARLPWNRAAGGDLPATVRALAAGGPSPAPVLTAARRSGARGSR